MVPTLYGIYGHLRNRELAMSLANQPQRGGQGPVNDHGILIDPTPAQINRVEQNIRSLLEQLAIQQIEGIDSPDDVDVRDLIPSEDLDSGSDNGWTTGTREWTQSGLTADSFNETYSIDGDVGNAQNKITALLAVSSNAASPATTEVRLETGTGGTFERFQVEGLLTDQEVLGLIADPVINLPDQVTNIHQYATATTDELLFVGAVAEKTSTTLEPAQRFASNQSQRV